MVMNKIDLNNINFNGSSSGGGGGDSDAVLYTPQTLTEAQQMQARANIDAYQKPSSGIPVSDLESGTIPTVPTISTDIESDKTSNLKTASPKAVYDFTATPIREKGGDLIAEQLQAGVKYKFMREEGVTTLILGLSPRLSTDRAYFWYCKFRSGATPTNVIWPTGLNYPNKEIPTIEANTIYEIMIDEDYCLTIQSYGPSNA